MRDSPSRGEGRGPRRRPGARPFAGCDAARTPPERGAEVPHPLRPARRRPGTTAGAPQANAKPAGHPAPVRDSAARRAGARTASARYAIGGTRAHTPDSPWSGPGAVAAPGAIVY
ncbi:hypothetical protein [Streptomyces californicus]|uniref:hypothetical protein n=1 Tax=Streptomyces californicus TaxID=67351 RepID=UPI0037182E0D